MTERPRAEERRHRSEENKWINRNESSCQNKASFRQNRVAFKDILLRFCAATHAETRTSSRVPGNVVPDERPDLQRSTLISHIRNVCPRRFGYRRQRTRRAPLEIQHENDHGNEKSADYTSRR